MSTGVEAPIYVLPVVGFRVWFVDDDGCLWPRTSEFAITRALVTEPWAVGTNHARCLLEGVGRPFHPVPANDCMCGLYGWHSPAAALRACRAGSGLIAGAIIAWGDLQVHPSGFRAEHARPVALAAPAHAGGLRRWVHVPPGRVYRAAERYGIPAVDREQLADDAVEAEPLMPARFTPRSARPVPAVLSLPGPAKPIRVEPVRDPEPRREPIEVPDSPPDKPIKEPAPA
jgi:hypothetical protein